MSQTTLATPHFSPQARRVPRGERRRQEIVAVAEAMFLKHGYADTTMQMIASEAGASKETLYRHFISKEDLFAEIVRARSCRFWEGSRIFDDGKPPAYVLKAVGQSILHAIGAPDGPAFVRMIVAEIPRTPELGAIFFDEGPDKLLRDLTRYLSGASGRGDLDCRDAARAARIFIGSVVALFNLTSLLAPERLKLDEAEIRIHVSAAVAMFMARYGTGTAR